MLAKLPKTFCMTVIVIQRIVCSKAEENTTPAKGDCGAMSFALEE